MTLRLAIDRFLEKFATAELPLLYGGEFPREYRVEYCHENRTFTLTSTKEVTYVCNRGKPEESHHTTPVEMEIPVWTHTDCEIEKDFANVVIYFPNFNTCVYSCSLDRLFETVLQILHEDL